MQTNSLIVDLYIRVSTGHQVKEGNSLEAQENELKKYCEYKGYKIRKTLIERGKSAGNTKRPEYQMLLTDVKEQKINAVIVKKLDRLSRSLLDFESFMKLAQENNVEFISIKDSFDTTTALGKAMLRIAMIFAQLEREQTSERLIDVFAFRASQGLYNGGVRPFGYTNINKELVPYIKERQMVETIFNQFLQTKSTTETAKFLNETGQRDRGNKLWDKRKIHKILQNPIYLGKVKWNGEIFQGIHQPIVSEKQFLLAQEIFKKRRYITDKNKTFSILQGRLLCGGCGSPMTPSHSLNRHRQKYFYYRCTSTYSAEKKTSKCKVKYVPFKKIETQVTDYILTLPTEQNFNFVENKILKHNQAIQAEKEIIKQEQTNFGIKQQETKAKKEKYLDTLISSPFLSSERKIINDKITELELEEKQIQGQIYKTQFEHTQKTQDLIDLTEFKKVIIHFKSEYETFTQNELKIAISELIKTITYHPDTLQIHFRLLPWSIPANSQ